MGKHFEKKYTALEKGNKDGDVLWQFHIIHTSEIDTKMNNDSIQGDGLNKFSGKKDRRKMIEKILKQEKKRKSMLECWSKRVNYLWCVFVFLMVVYVLNWNVTVLNSDIVPPPLGILGISLGLDQKWNMFSPTPPTNNWWLNIQATLADNRQVEIFTEEGLKKWKSSPFTGEPGKEFHKSIGNTRWEKFFEDAFIENFPNVRLEFGRYVCREWNARNKDGDVLWQFHIIHTSETITIDGSPPHRFTPTKISFHKCFDYDVRIKYDEERKKREAQKIKNN